MEVLVKSIYDAFRWVQKQQRDPDAGKYAVISIQDSHTGGFGIRFTENARCTGVLTLLVDDIVNEIEGLTLFDAEMADAVIDFIEAHKDADTLLVHCYAGQSRSRAVGAFAEEMLGQDDTALFTGGVPNMHIYDLLEATWTERQIKAHFPDA